MTPSLQRDCNVVLSTSHQTAAPSSLCVTHTATLCSQPQQFCSKVRHDELFNFYVCVGFRFTRCLFPGNHVFYQACPQVAPASH